MKKVFFKTMMGASFACMLLTGCVESVKDLYDPNYVIQQYQKNWTDSIGQIDPNQTWNMAKRVTAEIDLTGAALGGSLVNIYTANPLTPSTKLLATATIADYDAIEFDMPKALNYVYVSVQNGSALSGYYRIKDGIVTVAKGMTRADEICNVTLGEIVDMGTFYDYKINGETPYPGTLYHLNGVTKTDAAAWLYMDYVPLFGKNGYWSEGTNNYETYKGQWNVDADIVYETIEEGPVEITYAFGSTQCKNTFGYFYFKDGATTEEILAGKKYILVSDAQPTSNIRVEGLVNNFVYNQNDALGNWYQYNMWEDGTFQGGNPFVIGSTYKLVYFDENGNASYTFPAGLNIGFFMITNGVTTTSEVGDWMAYSMPSLNVETGKTYETAEHRWDNPSYAGVVRALTYKYGETLMLGFEDNLVGGDMDMNDIIFFVKSNLRYAGDEENIEEFPIVTPEVEAQEWILACEDLGTTDDFDFNDVVFSVKYVAGATTAVITPLAAGGTMPAQICYNGTVIGKEIHEWFGVSTNTMINTTSRGKAAESVEISVGDDFTMTKEMGGFTIDVNNGTTTVVAPAAGAAPQMILVSDANWSWPYERVRISDAYGLFAEWASSSTTNEDWYTTPTGKTVDGDYSNSSTGEEGTGGSGSGEGGNTGEGGNIGNEVVVDLNAVIANGNVIPASYFTSSTKVEVIVKTKDNVYVQFGASVGYTGWYIEKSQSYSFVFEINNTTDAPADAIQKVGLPIVQGAELIESITIINY